MCNCPVAGLLGGSISGVVAGYGVFWLNRLLRLPKNLAGLKPVLLLPLLGTLLTGIIMYYVIGTPAALLNQFLTAQLRGLESGAGTIALGALLGAMMGFDMGGPVNKAAYAFSTGLLEAGIYMPMAASMAGGMTPPLAAALATRLFPNRFTMEEKKAGGAALVLGLAFVSEGAIPFAARDPLRVIPSFVLGSAVAGAAAMALGVRLMAPHGGIFVLPIPKAMDGIAEYSVALAAGTAVSAFLLGLLKRPYDSSIESGFSREKGGAVDERGKMNFFKKICNFFRKQV